MWVRTDTWDRTAAWGEHDTAPPPDVTFAPWMRYRATTTLVPQVRNATSTHVPGPVHTTTDAALADATSTGVALATATTTAVP